MYKPVRVFWGDACSCSKWHQHNEEDDSVMKVCSVGYLISKNKKTITLALNIAPEENDLISDCVTIPMSWVTKIESLK